ncbi:MAG: Fic family protein [Bacilli bacterium]|nr:Fic family protein [Bacilli bacterium]
MKDHIKVLELLSIKQFLTVELSEIIFGSIEIRDDKYIYVHYKNDGLTITKYIGEYSEELYNLIMVNNSKAKDIKKEIRRIEKELHNLNFIDHELPKEVAISIDFAKSNLSQTIYQQAILEGISTTLPDTENIIEDGIVKNMAVNDIAKIINLKHAWEFILNKNVITSPSDYSVLRTINKLVEEGFYYSAGNLRSTPVKIGGTKWLPDIPIESLIKEDIDNIINSNKNNLDIAIELLLYVTKKQMFIDGNKRTSVIFANHYLISKGEGLLIIPDKMVDKYKKLLINYYENNKKKEIIEFLKKDCYLKIKN